MDNQISYPAQAVFEVINNAFKYNTPKTDYDYIKEAKIFWGNNPEEFAAELSEVGFSEQKVFNAICDNFTFEQLKPYTIIIDKMEKRIRYNNEHYRKVLNDGEMKKSPSETLEHLIAQDYRYDDIINFMRDVYCFDDLLAEISHCLCGVDCKAIQIFLNKNNKE